MKKYYFLIIVALILGLVLTGCSLLSNISQVPATEQSGITYLTKNGLLPNLVGLWHLDEEVGTIASDSSGNDNHGTLTNMSPPGCWVSGMFGQALSFDGINDYVDCGSNVGSFDLSEPFTIEAWINPALNYKNNVIYGNAWAEPGYHVRVTLENKVRFILIQTGSIYKGIDSSVLTAGWHHIAAVWDGISVKIYIDGEDDSQIAIENGTVTTITTTANTKIGLDTAPAAHYFNGLIDEVRIWNTALTADQLILYDDYSGLLAPYKEPPKAFKSGSSIPLKWQYKVSDTVVNSSTANPSIEIKSVEYNGEPTEGDPIVADDPGSSGYHYDSENNTWHFNWQTEGYDAGDYNIYIINDWTGQAFGPCPIKLR